MSSTPFVALAGNPNCGKTTLFNALTGLRHKVANYPGVTVEKREGSFELDGFGEIRILDLPGIYSLSALSHDERIAAAVLTGQLPSTPTPDIVVAVIDATNIERNLYLVSQLIDCNVPLVIALNMTDLAEKQGVQIYRELLRKELDVPIVSLVANKGKGIDELSKSLAEMLRRPTPSTKRFAWFMGNDEYRCQAQALGEAFEKLHPATAPPLFIGSGLLSETIISRELAPQIDEARKALAGLDSYSFETTQRYAWINNVVRKSCVLTPHTGTTLGEKLDTVITHRIWGTIIFLSVMGFIFQSIFLWAQVPMDLIDRLFASAGTFVGSLLPPGQLRSLVVDGIIAGVGSVIVFVPQIAILFFFLGLLEDSGYLSRAAFLMDRVLRPFGLQGRSFIPLLSSFACAIPGILSSRTIPSWADRLATILVAPLMSCSARLPVYAVLIGAFVPQRWYLGFISLQGLVLLMMYLLGIAGACVVAWALKHSLLRGKPALFVMEMPPFRLPTARVVFGEVYDSVKSFLSNAGTMILACSVVLWFLASYPRPPHTTSGMPEEKPNVQSSYAGQIGTALEPVIRPLGFNWEIGVGILASFAAREVFVSALSTVYNLQEGEDTSGTLTSVLRQKKNAGTFSTLTAMSLMVFYVFACQCMSTLAVTKRETASLGWTAFMFIYMTLLAYVMSLVVYQGGKWLGYG